jgi:hypothetical protein
MWSEWQRGSARGQMEKISAGKFHVAPLSRFPHMLMWRKDGSFPLLQHVRQLGDV